MSVSTLAGSRLSSRLRLPTAFVSRYASVYHGRALFDGKLDVRQEPAKIKVQLPGNPKGFFAYERNVSNDPNYKYQLPGDTVSRLIFGRIKQEKGLWGLYFAVLVVSPLLLIGTVIWSFSKIEIWVNHARFGAAVMGDDEHHTNWDWEKIRDNYWKKPIFFMYQKEMAKRLPEMEKLQDAMLEESKKRGAHKSVAFQ
jgi:hypothetical protein